MTTGLENNTIALLLQVTAVMLEGQVITGIGVRVTTMSNEQMFVPQELVAKQTTVFVPTLNGLPLAGTQPRSVPPVTTGLVNNTIAVLLHVRAKILVGQVMTGTGVCVTTMLNEQKFVPQALVAKQTTVFVPK